MEQIIFELNNRKYLLVELMVTSNTHKRMNDLGTKYDCIYQGVKEINRGGLFSNSYMVIKILVPEENINAFNNEH